LQEDTEKSKECGNSPAVKLNLAKLHSRNLRGRIREELANEIKADELIDMIEYDYTDFHLSMDCFWCEVVSGDLILLETCK